MIIGIISYLPTGNLRERRKQLLCDLLTQLSVMFPSTKILLVAQNYQQQDINEIRVFSNVEIHTYSQLGLGGARNELKRLFLNTSFNQLVMFDDDCILTGDRIDGQLYEKEISEHKNEIVFMHYPSLKMCCVPRSLYSQMPPFKEKYNTKQMYEYLPNKHYVCVYPYTIDKSKLINGFETSTWKEDIRLKYLK